jgi:hypothetical protein
METFMFRRWLIVMVTVLLSSIGVVGAQDQGSTLQVFIDTPATALDLTEDIEQPMFRRGIANISQYTSSGDPVLSCVSRHSYSVWQTFVAPQTGYLYFQSLASNYNLVVAVYRNTPTAQNQIRCVNYAGTRHYEEARFRVTAGTRYYMMFAAVGAGFGVTSNSTITTYYTGNAWDTNGFEIPASGIYTNTQEHIENARIALYLYYDPCPDFSNVVYYRFRPSTSGRYEISTQGSNYDTVIVMYRDNPERTYLGCSDNIDANNNNSLLEWDMQAGETYIIGVAAVWEGSDPVGPLTLTISTRKL